MLKNVEPFTRPPICTIAKGASRTLIVAEREYKGRTFLDMREWVDNGATATGKGITIPLDAVADVARALAHYAESLALEPPKAA